MSSHASYISGCHCNMDCHHCSIPRSKGSRHSLQAYCTIFYPRRPSDIVLQGTRRALILHLRYYHISLTRILKRSCQDFWSMNPSEGRCCWSPWVDFGINHASSRGNADRDIVSAQTLNSWARIFLGRTVEDEYNCPAKAPARWWRDLPVSRIFVGAGGDEVLLDPIRETAENMKVRWSSQDSFLI